MVTEGERQKKEPSFFTKSGKQADKQERLLLKKKKKEQEETLFPSVFQTALWRWVSYKRLSLWNWI